MKRGAVCLVAGIFACGALGKPEHAAVEVKRMDETDGGAAWEGDACITLPSVSAPIDVPNVVIDGDLHKGRRHCYLDLQHALCVHFPHEADADVDDRVPMLRLAGTCDDQTEVRFRGKLHGVLEPVRVGGRPLWAVDAFATSIERASRTIDVDTSDASSVRMELLKAFLFRCWREGTVAAPTTNAHLTLDVAVSPSGEVTDARARDAVGVSAAVQSCILEAVREPQMFLEADAGAPRNLSMRVSFSLLVAPLPP